MRCTLRWFTHLPHTHHSCSLRSFFTVAGWLVGSAFRFWFVRGYLWLPLRFTPRSSPRFRCLRSFIHGLPDYYRLRLYLSHFGFLDSHTFVTYRTLRHAARRLRTAYRVTRFYHRARTRWPIYHHTHTTHTTALRLLRLPLTTVAGYAVPGLRLVYTFTAWVLPLDAAVLRYRRYHMPARLVAARDCTVYCRAAVRITCHTFPPLPHLRVAVPVRIFFAVGYLLHLFCYYHSGFGPAVSDTFYL